MKLAYKWDEKLASDGTLCGKLQQLKSLKNNNRLQRTYWTVVAGAKGLDSPGSWTPPAIRAAFFPLQSLTVEVNSFNGDWREIATDFEAIGVDFYALFEGPNIARPANALTQQATSLLQDELEEGGN